MSLHAEYLAVLERARNIQECVSAIQLRGHLAGFLGRRWVVEDGHLTHILVPVLDGEDEVEVRVDEEVRTFSYDSPACRSRKITRPLSEIAIYAFNVEAWLDDLAKLIGIEPRQMPNRRVQMPNHLWHLGNVRIAGTHDFAPVFVGRLWERTSDSEVTSVLCDPIWPRGGVLLRHRPTGNELPREHVMRGLCDFVRVDEEGHDVFDTSAFDRVLRGFVTPRGTREPPQFLQGNRLKLPPFPNSRELSPERVKIIKVMWGVEGKAPPEMSWAEVNVLANTGYQSFDDAFGGVDAREEVIEKAGRARYRIRRNP